MFSYQAHSLFSEYIKKTSNRMTYLFSLFWGGNKALSIPLLLHSIGILYFFFSRKVLWLPRRLGEQRGYAWTL